MDELEKMIPGFIYAGRAGEVDYLGAYYPSYEETASMADPDERVYALVDTTDLGLEPGVDVRRAIAGAFVKQYDDITRNEKVGFDLVAFEADVENALVALRFVKEAAERAGVALTAEPSVEE